MNQPLAVLYVHHTSILGGAEQSLADLIAGMNRQAIRPVLAVPEDGPLAEALFSLGVEVYLAPIARMKRTWNPLTLAGYCFGVLSGARALSRIATDHGIRIIHANSIYSAPYASLAARFAGTGSVCHLRDIVPARRRARMLAGGFDALVPISAAVARFHRVDPECVIPSGIDFRRFDTEATGTPIRTDAGIPRGVPVIGNASRFVPWKNHGDFLRAAARILAEVKDAHFIVAGDDTLGDHPSYEKGLCRLAEELGIAERVRFVGWRDDVAELYAAMDLLVHPALDEPFGRALVEAMGCGVPVVAYDGAGPAEIVKEADTGHLVPAGNWEALASRAIEILRNDELRAELGAAAKKDVRARFAADLIAYRVMKVYGLEI